MTTLEHLTTLVIDKFKVDTGQLTPDRPLATLGLDSLSMVELLFMIEDEFSVKLPADIELFPTLAVAADYIDELRAAQRGAAGAPLPQPPA